MWACYGVLSACSVREAKGQEASWMDTREMTFKKGHLKGDCTETRQLFADSFDALFFFQLSKSPFSYNV